MSKINLRDSVSLNDRRPAYGRPTHGGLWAKTEIIAGYGRHTTPDKGSYLDKVLFKRSNMVPIGGVQYVMEKLFNVSGQVNTGYISDPDFPFPFGADTDTSLNTIIDPLTGKPVAPYSPQHHVCLFGVGTGGAPENSVTATDVSYNERALVQPIPFRIVSAEDSDNYPALTSSEAAMYWGKKVHADFMGVSNATLYYAKQFDSDPEIIHLWRDNPDPDEDGTNVTESGAGTVFDSIRTEGIESFTEINLTISKKDLKQYFNAIGMPESARINELALYCAEKDSSRGDFTNIKLFSKLNFQTEPLSTTKDMEIIYRVYGS